MTGYINLSLTHTLVHLSAPLQTSQSNAFSEAFLHKSPDIKLAFWNKYQGQRFIEKYLHPAIAVSASPIPLASQKTPGSRRPGSCHCVPWEMATMELEFELSGLGWLGLEQWKNTLKNWDKSVSDWTCRRPCKFKSWFRMQLPKRIHGFRCRSSSQSPSPFASRNISEVGRFWVFPSTK